MRLCCCWRVRGCWIRRRYPGVDSLFMGRWVGKIGLGTALYGVGYGIGNELGFRVVVADMAAVVVRRYDPFANRAHKEYFFRKAVEAPKKLSLLPFN